MTQSVEISVGSNAIMEALRDALTPLYPHEFRVIQHADGNFIVRVIVPAAHFYSDRLDEMRTFSRGFVTCYTQEAERYKANAEHHRVAFTAVVRGIKDALGLENWPDMPGDFREGVCNLVRERISQN